VGRESGVRLPKS